MKIEKRPEHHSQVLESGVGDAAKRAAAEIRGLMGKRKVNAVDLAQVLGVSPSTAKRRVNGQTDLGITELETIAEWLDVPVMRIINPPAEANYGK